MEKKRSRPNGEEDDNLKEVTVSCSKCKAEIGTFKRKKKREKMCKKCLSEKRAKRDEENPIRLVEARLRASLSAKKIKIPSTVDLNELVKRVCTRWDNKSVLSKEEDMTKLCITGYKKLKEGIMPDENELVLVTSSESIQLSRYKTEESRVNKFPLEIRGKILNKT